MLTTCNTQYEKPVNPFNTVVDPFNSLVDPFEVVVDSFNMDGHLFNGPYTITQTMVQVHV